MSSRPTGYLLLILREHVVALLLRRVAVEALGLGILHIAAGLRISLEHIPSPAAGLFVLL